MACRPIHRVGNLFQRDQTLDALSFCAGDPQRRQWANDRFSVIRCVTSGIPLLLHPPLSDGLLFHPHVPFLPGDQPSVFQVPQSSFAMFPSAARMKTRDFHFGVHFSDVCLGLGLGLGFRVRVRVRVRQDIYLCIVCKFVDKCKCIIFIIVQSFIVQSFNRSIVQSFNRSIVHRSIVQSFNVFRLRAMWGAREELRR